MNRAPELIACLPLAGLVLIEASAGTGKTHALCSIVLRLVIERGLRLTQIGLITFTRAATAEMRARLRLRLRSAEEALERGEAYPLPTHITRSAAQARLRLAALDLDLAPISTVHSFAEALLADAGLRSASVATTRVDLPQLADALARDYLCRGHGAEAARVMARLGPDLHELSRALERCMPTDVVVEPASASWSPLLKLFDWLREARQQWQPLADQAAEIGELLSASMRPASARSKGVKLAAIVRRLGHDADLKVVLRRLADLELPSRIGDGDLAQAIEQLAALPRAANEARIAVFLDALRYATSKRGELLHERRWQSHDDALVELDQVLLSAPQGPAFARSIATRLPAILVDEFQDTDPLQWRILRTIHDASADQLLLLVGDPKQSIYRFRGADVHTYLHARQSVAAGQRFVLNTNWRSIPPVLDAIASLYAAAGDYPAFGHRDISFEPVTPAIATPADGLYRWVDGIWQRVSALTLWRAPAQTIAADYYAATRAATVSYLVDWFTAQRRGEAKLVRGGADSQLEPGGVGVLVPTRAHGLAIQRALADAGIAAVLPAGSVLESAEFATMRALLLALAEPASAARLRRFLITDLGGFDTRALADPEALAQAQAQCARWALRLRSSGTLALVQTLIRDAAERLLGLADGERRLTNLRHLAELVETESGAARDPRRAARWLQRAQVDERGADEARTRQLRLEVESNAVTVTTIHTAKGLEYDLVLLPYAAYGYAHQESIPRLPRPGGGRRAVLGVIDGDTAAISDGQRRQEIGDALRLIYVALTRARYAVVASTASLSRHEFSGLNLLLSAGQPDALARALTQWTERPQLIDVQPLPLVQPERLPPAEQIAPGPAFPLTRTVSSHWQVHSYSALATLAQAVDDDDEPAAEEARTSAPGGTAFGLYVHELLERVDYRHWVAPPSAPQLALLTDLARRHGMPEAAPLAAELVRATAHTPLVLPTRTVTLAEIPAADLSRELAFDLTLKGGTLATLDQLLRRHGLLNGRSTLGHEALRGLLTGVIDLVVRVDGHYTVIDYKTNLLERYDAPALAQAVRDHAYDLQYAIYVLALYRWLALKLGADAALAACGSVRYLFLRGLAAGAGVHAHDLPRPLIIDMAAWSAGQGEK